jgi:hypothetical protein
LRTSPNVLVRAFATLLLTRAARSEPKQLYWFLSRYHVVLAVKALRCSQRFAPLLYSPESMPPGVGIES